MTNARDRIKSSRLSRLLVGSALALSLCALGAAPTSSCGPPAGGAGTGGGSSDPSVPYCGDGRMNDPLHGEQCDGNDLGGKTCETYRQGMVGTLRCKYCRLDGSDCKLPTCGNGRLDPGESCDGSNLDGATCGEPPEGLERDGDVQCAPNCDSIDRRRCFKPVGSHCGNGIVETSSYWWGGGEACDGPIPCASLVPQGYPADYYADGVVQCSADCREAGDVSECKLRHCGNGIAEPEYHEQCDGSDFGGMTCETYWPLPLGGTLRCNRDCQFDVTLCHGCHFVRGLACL